MGESTSLTSFFLLKLYANSSAFQFSGNENPKVHKYNFTVSSKRLVMPKKGMRRRKSFASANFYTKNKNSRELRNTSLSIHKKKTHYRVVSYTHTIHIVTHKHPHTTSQGPHTTNIIPTYTTAPLGRSAVAALWARRWRRWCL